MGPRTTAFRIEKGGSYRWIAFGCGGLILVSVCVLVGAFFAVKSATLDPPTQAAEAFFADLRARSYATALQRMSPAYQSTHDLAAFQQSITLMPPLWQHTDETLGARDIGSDRAEIEASLETPTGVVPVRVTLVKLAEHWYVESLSVNQMPMQ